MRKIGIPELSSRTALVGDGGGRDMQSGSRGAFTQYNSSAENSSPAVSSLGRSNLERRSSAAPSFIPLPSGSIRSPVPTLKSLNLSQAILDGLAVVVGFLFLAALFGSLPLAVALMILGVL